MKKLLKILSKSGIPLVNWIWKKLFDERETNIDLSMPVGIEKLDDSVRHKVKWIKIKIVLGNEVGQMVSTSGNFCIQKRMGTVGLSV